MSDRIDPLNDSARLIGVREVMRQWRQGKLTDEEAWRAVRAYVLDAERGDE